MTEGNVEVGSLRVHFREAGSGDPVLLIHGWPVDSRLWSRQIERLGERHRVLALDLPGYGESDPPGEVSFDVLVGTVAGFLDAVGIERAAVVGHDVGGAIALLAAIRHPERVSRLVVMDTTPYPELPLLIRLLVLAGRIPGLGALLVSRLGFRLLFRLGTAGPGIDAGALADRFRPADRARRVALVDAIRRFDRRELEEVEAGLGLITCPTLVLWAAADPTGPLLLAHRLAAGIPGSTLVKVPDCGHFLPLNRPTEVGDLLAAFLD